MAFIWVFHLFFSSIFFLKIWSVPLLVVISSYFKLMSDNRSQGAGAGALHAIVNVSRLEKWVLFHSGT